MNVTRLSKLAKNTSKIEDVLDSKCLGHRLHYLVKWEGYPDSEKSWEPLANIPVRGLIKEFLRQNPDSFVLFGRRFGDEIR